VTKRLEDAYVTVDAQLAPAKRAELEALLAECPLAPPRPRSQGYRDRARTLPKHARPRPEGTL